MKPPADLVKEVFYVNSTQSLLNTIQPNIIIYVLPGTYYVQQPIYLPSDIVIRFHKGTRVINEGDDFLFVAEGNNISVSGYCEATTKRLLHSRCINVSVSIAKLVSR